MTTTKMAQQRTSVQCLKTEYIRWLEMHSIPPSPPKSFTDGSKWKLHHYNTISFQSIHLCQNLMTRNRCLNCQQNICQAKLLICFFLGKGCLHQKGCSIDECRCWTKLMHKSRRPLVGNFLLSLCKLSLHDAWAAQCMSWEKKTLQFWMPLCNLVRGKAEWYSIAQALHTPDTKQCQNSDGRPPRRILQKAVANHHCFSLGLKAACWSPISHQCLWKHKWLQLLGVKN